MDFGRGTVDLIREHQVSKDGTQFTGKFRRLLVVDDGAEDIRRKKIWSERGLRDA